MRQRSQTGSSLQALVAVSPESEGDQPISANENESEEPIGSSVFQCEGDRDDGQQQRGGLIRREIEGHGSIYNPADDCQQWEDHQSDLRRRSHSNAEG